MHALDFNEIDNWFFDLPAFWQSEITGIAIDEDNATDADYEDFDDAISDWWYNLDYTEKIRIYEEEEGEEWHGYCS